MERYFKMITDQYRRATGIKNVDMNSIAFMEELKEWLKRNSLIGKDYKKILDQLDVFPQHGVTTAEVGKGAFDSIALDSDMAIITPYPMGIDSTKNQLIISEFEVVDNNPVIFPNKINEMVVPSDNFDRFITQNPYDYTSLINWENLHNGDRNITVGMYGSIYDKDYHKKIEFLKSFKEKLYAGYHEESITSGDSYFYMIYSGDLIKRKNKVLTRENYLDDECENECSIEHRRYR